MSMNENRLILTNSLWHLIQGILVTHKHNAGTPPEQSDRKFIEAVLYIARTGCPWRDLPEALGDWHSVSTRFYRWRNNGLWKKIWECIREKMGTTINMAFFDSTIVRAHQHAAGARKENADGDEALGRSKGGSPQKSMQEQSMKIRSLLLP